MFHKHKMLPSKYLELDRLEKAFVIAAIQIKLESEKKQEKEAERNRPKSKGKRRR